MHGLIGLAICQQRSLLRQNYCCAYVPEAAVKHVAVAGSLPTADKVGEAATTPRVKNVTDMFISTKDVCVEVSLRFGYVPSGKIQMLGRICL